MAKNNQSLVCLYYFFLQLMKQTIFLEERFTADKLLMFPSGFIQSDHISIVTCNKKKEKKKENDKMGKQTCWIGV